MSTSIEQITRERDDALRIIANLQTRCDTAEKRCSELEEYATQKTVVNDRLHGEIEDLKRKVDAVSQIVEDKEQARKRLSRLAGTLLLCLLDNLELLADEFKDDESRVFYDRLMEAIKHNMAAKMKTAPETAEVRWMRTSWFTFGQDHVHRYGEVTLDRDIVVQITAFDPRSIMVDLFGTKWCMEYAEVPDLSKYPRGVFVL